MRTTMRSIRLLSIFVLITFTLSAMALERTFPATTQRGNFTITAYPTITINDKVLRLSPGSRIWNTNHLTQTPVSLGNATYVVNFTQNTQGEVDRVWILTPDEAKQRVENQRNNQRW